MKAEALLSQWKTWLGWNDFEWEFLEAGAGPLVCKLKGADAGRLAAQDGEALAAFQYLFSLTLVRRPEERDRVKFTVEGVEGAEDAKNRRLADMAVRAASDVKRSGRVFRFDPMPPGDRKVLHQALAGDMDVETTSEGEGPWRKVVIKPKLKIGGAANKPRLR